MKWLWEHRKILLLNVLGSIIGAALYEQRELIWSGFAKVVEFVAQIVAAAAAFLFDLLRHTVEHPSVPLAIIVVILGRVALSMLSAEARGFLHLLSKRLVLLAARRLPDKLRPRWTEEWLAELDYYADRPLTGVLFAGRVLASARRLR